MLFCCYFNYNYYQWGNLIVTITEILRKIMNDYRRATNESFKAHPIQSVFSAIPETFSRELNLGSNFSLKGGYGQGNWATFPWIALYNNEITRSSQKGYYIVFLFDYEMNNVFLTLNQGFTWFQENFPNDEITNIEKLAIYLSKELKINRSKPILDPRNATNIDKKIGYEAGSIYSKKFLKDELNQEKIIIELNHFISLLNQTSKIVGGSNWEVFNRNTLKSIPTLNEYIKLNYEKKSFELGNKADIQRREFLNKFPLNNLKNLTLEQYSKKGNTNSFTNLIENHTNEICSGNFGSEKNKLFYEEDGRFVTPKFLTKESGNVEEKFSKFIIQMHDFITSFTIDNYDANDFIYGNNALKFKPLRLYRPEISLYGLPSKKRIKEILNYLNIQVQDNIDSIKNSISLTKYLLERDSSLTSKNTDIINGLIWDFYTKFIPKTDAEEEFEDTDKSNKEAPNMNVKDLIELEINNKVTQLILTGAPGTGKTFGVLEFVKLRVGEIPYQTKQRHEFVQFHPSYDYTDFVEGIRPKEENGRIQFVKQDGIFKKFCRKAAQDNQENKYYFIIDEINRADLSKVFGELMYALEENYRGKIYRVTTQFQNLKTDGLSGQDIFADGFYIPENVVIIGTMNDIDRSVESIDFALRRRFRWINIKANEILEPTLTAMWKPTTLKGLVERIIELNKVISGEKGKKLGLDENYHVGPAYFKSSDEKDLIKYLNQVWITRIEPLIKEYVRGRKADLVESFIQDCKTALLGNA